MLFSGTSSHGRPRYTAVKRVLVIRRCSLLLLTKLSVCLSDTLVSPAKAAKPIEMLFGIVVKFEEINLRFEKVRDPHVITIVIGRHSVVLIL